MAHLSSSQKSHVKDLKKTSEHSPDLMRMTVVKRDGTMVPFRHERICRALELAFRDTKKIGIDEVFPSDLKEIVTEVADQVVEQLESFASKGASLTVEGIQDVVEVTLMKLRHHDVARDYIIYRDHHKQLRIDSPQNLKIFRRDGSLVRFNPMKIASSIEGAFRRTWRTQGLSSPEIIEAVNSLTEKVVERAVLIVKEGGSLHVTRIQDSIENLLMEAGFFDIAKDYILYRASIGEQSLQEPEEILVKKEKRHFDVLSRDGSTYTLDEDFLKNRLQLACSMLSEVSADELLESTILNFYEGMKEHEVDLAMIMSARARIEVEENYSKVAARLLCDVLYRESVQTSIFDAKIETLHRSYFKKYIQLGISLERLSPALLEFDLDKLGQALDLKRDDLFSYLGLQTLYDRYFIHDKERRLETPQIFWMRVAMGLSLNEGKEKTDKAIEFYNLLSTFAFTSGTPTLFNSGTVHSQLSSCYLSTIMDDLGHIFKVVADDAQLSKWAGGIGNDWSYVRATGATIKGTNGKSQGVIPFLKVANDTAVAVNQCFDPDTRIFTSCGVQPINDVSIGDLVLGISGTYKQVTNKFVYNQTEPMVEIDIKHSLEGVKVTTAHPFYVIRNVPLAQANERTLSLLNKGKVCCEWVEAGQLQKGDLVAQVIPKETVPVACLDEEDARLYGILLGDGHLSQDGYEWGVSGNPQKDTHLKFVRHYLSQRGIHSWETSRGDRYVQIHWTQGQSAVRDATNGRVTESGSPTLPFTYADLYDHEKKKHIAPRFAHLPKRQALAMLQGLLETDGHVSRGKEMVFTNTSLHLVEGIRYQCLRFGIPTAGNLRIPSHNHKAQRSDRASPEFNCTTHSYDLRIPAFAELASLVGRKPITKHNWLTYGGFVFSRVKSINPIPHSMAVCDLEVEGDESYMTTSGLAHNGGKRKGAMCAYLETWHLDIEDFLELRKNTGDERRRTHDMNTANWIPDLFMKRVMNNEMWTLFSPSDAPDLHDLYGQAFEKRYTEYEKMVDDGKLKLFKKIEALQLWRKMLSMLFETGHPWITFKDPSNIRSPQDHVGVVHSSNLCTEILLNTSAEETAVCNLGSINLPLHCTEHGLDEKKLAQTIKTAIRMLDNVIDINYYPTPEARVSNAKHRPIGMGIMGFQDCLYIQNISYASHAAVAFADSSMELVSYYAILASSELAQERGPYESYKGSKWDRGLLPIDTIKLLAEERGGHLEMDTSSQLNWDVVRASVKKYGMRNSNTMAIAPTATISNITGVTQSIEPMYKHLFVKSNLSGEFTIPNSYLAQKLKALGLWDQEMLDDLKYFDGSISEIERIPDEVKQVYLTAFEIDPDWIIECASRRQKWIDMGESLNLYMAEPSGKKLNQMYFLGWTKGLKTFYYLRSSSATQLEKSTTDINKRGLQPRWMKNKSASSNIKVDREETENAPKVCNLEEGCESCQ
jgi:ribonucleoside-diphosphate reductase alpha chain